MAEFLITGPDGKKYRVTGDSAEGAVAALKKMLGQSAPAQSPAMAEGLAQLSDMTRNPAPPEKGAMDYIRPGATWLMDRLVPGMGTYTDAALGPAPQPGQQSVGQALYGNVVGNPDDGVTNAGEALGTWLNRGGESMTLGVVGDEASAAAYGMLPGRSYEGELDRFRKNEAGMTGVGRLSADLTGAMLPVLLSGGATAAPGLLGRASSFAAKIAPTNIAGRYIAGGSGILSNILRGGAAGGAMGGVQGFMEGEGGADDRLWGGLMGAGVGGGVGMAAGGLGGAISKWLDSSAARNAVSNAARAGRTTDELRASGNAYYDQVDNAGVQIRPEAFDRLRADALARLRANTGFDELPGPGSLTPNAARAMEIMDQASGKMAAEPTAALPFKSLDQMRRQAGAAAGNVTNKTDQKAGMEIIDALDDFVAKLGPDDVLAGDIKALQTAIPKAREIWGQMSRSQKIDDAIEAGGDYLSGASSGIRNQFKNLLRNPARLRGFSDAEKAAMRSVVNGGPLSQVINLAGGGMAQLLSVGAGLGFGGIPGALGGVALAAGQRKLSEAVTTAAAERVRAAIASGLLQGAGGVVPSSPANALGVAGALGLIPTVTNALRPQ